MLKSMTVSLVLCLAASTAALAQDVVPTAVLLSCPNGKLSASLTAMDYSQCQLDAKALDVLEKLGPFITTTDCARHSIRVSNLSGSVAAEGPLSQDETFALPVAFDSAKLRTQAAIQALATGVSRCAGDKPTSTDLNLTLMVVAEGAAPCGLAFSATVSCR